MRQHLGLLGLLLFAALSGVDGQSLLRSRYYAPPNPRPSVHILSFLTNLTHSLSQEPHRQRLFDMLFTVTSHLSFQINAFNNAPDNIAGYCQAPGRTIAAWQGIQSLLAPFFPLTHKSFRRHGKLCQWSHHQKQQYYLLHVSHILNSCDRIVWISLWSGSWSSLLFLNVCN